MRKPSPVILAVLLNVLSLNCIIEPVESSRVRKCTCSQLYSCSEWSQDFMEVLFTQDCEVKEDIVIANVKNFSIIGKSDNAQQRIITCTNLSSFIITNSSFIEIRNIRIINCGKRIANYKQTRNIFPSVTSTAIFIRNVSSIRMVNVTIGNSCGHAIVGLNVVGVFTIEHVIIHGNSTHPTSCKHDDVLFGGILALNLWEEDDDTVQQENTVITMTQCNFFNISSNNAESMNAEDENVTLLPNKYINSSAIGLIFHQMVYHIDVKIENINITNITNVNAPLIFFSYSVNSTSSVTMANSTITKTNATYSTIEMGFSNDTNMTSTILPHILHTFNISACRFISNIAYSILRMADIYKNSMELTLNNNVFSKNLAKNILQTKSTAPILYGSTEFSSNIASRIFVISDYFILTDNTIINFTDNQINLLHKIQGRYIIEKKYITSTLCPVQFTNNVNVKIIFNNNRGYKRLIYGNPLLGCAWISTFQNKNKRLPSEIYSKVMNLTYQNVTNALSGMENSICQCDVNGENNCLNVKHDPVYPGQSITLSFIHFNFDIAMYTNFTEDRFNATAPACNISSYNFSSPKIDLIFQHCTNVSYIIKSNSYRPPQIKTCLLLLSTATKEQTLYAFRVNLQRCPPGFALDYNEGICKCDPKFLLKLSGLSCHISNVAFGTPQNSWISSDSKGVIYAVNCHFDYCWQHPSLVQLTKPDSQCSHSRSGIACGECAPGLSAVFGTSRCKRCTSYWLFLLPLFAISGLLLVLALFVLNLTVVDGDIYGFIFMVNTLSIHQTRVFPSEKDAPWVLVSLFNLDLGVEVCFYNGMTAYSATWLRFMFPIYVLLIVVAMAFASRYFQIIEKITRKRVIPVIATLYLLSYNKLMLITFRVLFSYTIIHHLYDMDTDVYWSADTGIPLFGVRFTLLFIFCSFIFLFVIVPTNILFLFSKFSYRYAFTVNYLRPFLDAYQAPFRENCSYFLGVELLLRAAIFACSSLNAQNIGAIYNTLIVLYFAYLCQVKPFKSRFNSIVYCSYSVYASGFVILFMRFFPIQPKAYKIIFDLIVYLGIAEFLGIVMIHVWKYILCNFSLFIYFESQWKKKCELRNKKLDKIQHLPLAASYENFQEELLALSPGY